MSREYADPNCPICRGAGFVYPACLFTRPGERGGHYCNCALDALRLVNMDRLWPSLSKAKEFPDLRKDPPLAHFVSKDLWITAPVPVFRAHLKAVAFTKPTLWDCRVYPDAELITSWLGTAKAEGIKIYDLDVEQSTLQAIDLRDLVEPPDLVILLLGVKQLPNKEAPNSLLEAIGYRQHAGKPTWLVDQPDHRIDHVHHRFYSEMLEMWLARWTHVQLVGRHVRKADVSDASVSVVSDVEGIDAVLDAKIEDILSELDLTESSSEAPSEQDEQEEEGMEEPQPRQASASSRDTVDLSHTLTQPRKGSKPNKGWGKNS